MFEYVDWSYRGDYMAAKHGVSVREAHEALLDPERVVIRPDYNSKSGRAVRSTAGGRTAGTEPSTTSRRCTDEQEDD